MMFVALFAAIVLLKQKDAVDLFHYPPELHDSRLMPLSHDHIISLYIATDVPVPGAQQCKQGTHGLLLVTEQGYSAEYALMAIDFK